MQTHNTEACFQFCIQVNYLLLRVALTPGAKVGHRGPVGLIPFRVYPRANVNVPDKIEYRDVNYFLHSVVLNTWEGCPGEVPV